MSKSAERPQSRGIYILEELLDNFVARTNMRWASHDALRRHIYQKTIRHSRLQGVQAHVDDREEQAY
jgi:hypothetical protein